MNHDLLMEWWTYVVGKLVMHVSVSIVSTEHNFSDSLHVFTNPESMNSDFFKQNFLCFVFLQSM